VALPSLRGLTSRLLLNRLRTARAVARLAYRLHQRKPALIDRRGTLSYAQLQERVLRLQAWMRAQGLRKGDIVFTLLPETGEQYEARLATFENGTIFASFHKHLPPDAALATIERVRPALFIHDPLLSAPILDAVRARQPGLRLLALGADYEQALAGHAPAWGTEAVDEEDVFALHMTSGTTGLPKAIGYSHRKYLDSMRLIARSIDLRPSGRQRPVHMLGVPLTGPGSGMVLPTLLSGALLVMPEDFQARTLAALVQQLTAPAQPQRVVAVQPWPAALVPVVDAGMAGEGGLPGLPPLQTWLVRQGVVQTPEGERAFSLTLRVPVPWLQSQAQPAAAPAPAPPLTALFAGKPQALQSGTWALVLQSAEPAAARTSALLVLEFPPLAQVAVYGRDMLQARQDPWLQMAVLQASGHLPKDEDGIRDREAGLCQTPGCPYAGRASCAQPFCLALRAVPPPDPVEPLPLAGGGGVPASTPRRMAAWRARVIG